MQEQSSNNHEIPCYQYKCTCWACRLPSWVRVAFIRNVACELYYLRHAVPPLVKLDFGHWYVFRDTPDTVLFGVDYEFEGCDDERSREIFKNALGEIKLRARRAAQAQ